MSDDITMMLVVEVKLDFLEEIGFLALLYSKLIKQQLCNFTKTNLNVRYIHAAIKGHQFA